MALRLLIAAAVLVLAGGSACGGPDVRIFYGGDELGYLEPCGCSKPQVGGFPRRATLIARLAADAGATLLLERGNFVSAVNAQQRIKLEVILMMLSEMGCTAATLGGHDLSLGTASLHAVRQGARFPFVSANARSDLFVPYHLATVNVGGGSFRIGITAVTGEQEKSKFIAAGVSVDDPIPALKDVLRTLQGQTDYRVVLANVTERAARAIADECPGIDLIIAPGPDDEPLAQLEKIGQTVLALDGRRGKALGEVQLAVDAGRLICAGHAVHRLDENVADSPAITALMAYYEEVLQSEAFVEKLDRLPAAGGAFTGPSRCIGCHRWQHDVWSKAKHARALDALKTAFRSHDPECVVCHVTGLETRGGYVSEAATPDLASVSCESCHGAASEHVANPEAPWKRPGERDCLACHTPDHSPQFVFAEYLPKIEHRMPVMTRPVAGYWLFGGAAVAGFALFTGVQRRLFKRKYRPQAACRGLQGKRKTSIDH